MNWVLKTRLARLHSVEAAQQEGFIVSYFATSSSNELQVECQLDKMIDSLFMILITQELARPKAVPAIT